MVGDMTVGELWPLLVGVAGVAGVAGVVGVAVGLLVGVLLARGRCATQVAAAVAERDVLRDRVADLQAQTDRAIETTQFVGPLREALLRVERQVHTLERDRGEQFARVALELTRVQSSADGLREQTASLVGSLSSSGVRGSWGELSLQRVLEASGMLARCDLDLQPTLVGDDGTRRPDVVVHLPGNRHVAVDAKAPMTQFLAAQADGLDPEQRARKLRAHAKALRRHLDALAGKGYWQLVGTSPELVVCYVPGEAFLAAALDADPTLHEYALDRGVVLASPATLLALLRTIAVTWRQHSLAEGARELLLLGRQLYERIGGLARHTEAVGDSLARAVSAYNTWVGSLESRLLVTARRMEALGLGDDSHPVGFPAQVESVPRSLRSPELVPAADEWSAGLESPAQLARQGEDQ
ncbi:MAG: DNA recombination protein RmuC [Actinomycetales bacterium]|nr:MAG: DNA recombination protein RmuC [Actinomycetales bacterium]